MLKVAEEFDAVEVIQEFSGFLSKRKWLVLNPWRFLMLESKGFFMVGSEWKYRQPVRYGPGAIGNLPQIVKGEIGADNRAWVRISVNARSVKHELEKGRSPEDIVLQQPRVKDGWLILFNHYEGLRWRVDEPDFWIGPKNDPKGPELHFQFREGGAREGLIEMVLEALAG